MVHWILYLSSYFLFDFHHKCLNVNQRKLFLFGSIISLASWSPNSSLRANKPSISTQCSIYRCLRHLMVHPVTEKRPIESMPFTWDFRLFQHDSRGQWHRFSFAVVRHTTLCFDKIKNCHQVLYNIIILTVGNIENTETFWKLNPSNGLFN